jgi:hypothetical protein
LVFFGDNSIVLTYVAPVLLFPIDVRDPYFALHWILLVGDLSAAQSLYIVLELIPRFVKNTDEVRIEFVALLSTIKGQEIHDRHQW